MDVVIKGILVAHVIRRHECDGDIRNAINHIAWGISRQGRIHAGGRRQNGSANVAADGRRHAVEIRGVLAIPIEIISGVGAGHKQKLSLHRSDRPQKKDTTYQRSKE